MTDKIRAIEERLRERGLWDLLVRIASQNHVRPTQIIGDRRDQSICKARQDWYVAVVSENPRMSVSEIARLIGRDYSTLLKYAGHVRSKVA